MAELADRYTNCSFCEKKRSEVRWLIVGGIKKVGYHGMNVGAEPAEYPVSICEECTDLAGEIVLEERAKALARKERVEKFVEHSDPDQPSGYRTVRLVELRDGEEIVRKPGQSHPANGMMVT